VASKVGGRELAAGPELHGCPGGARQLRDTGPRRLTRRLGCRGHQSPLGRFRPELSPEVERPQQERCRMAARRCGAHRRDYRPKRSLGANRSATGTRSECGPGDNRKPLFGCLLGVMEEMNGLLTALPWRLEDTAVDTMGHIEHHGYGDTRRPLVASGGHRALNHEWSGLWSRRPEKS